MAKDSNDIFAVELTPPGVGAIAVILVAGNGSAAIVHALAASEKIPRMQVGSVTRVTLMSATQSDDPPSAIDDALIVRTGNDRWELHVHGGTAVVASVMQALRTLGALLLTTPQAAAQGLLGDGMDGELQVALSRAVTTSGLRLLLAQHRALAKWAEKWRNWLDESPKSSHDLWQFQSAIQWLLARSATLMKLFEPPRVAIIGAPNAGKSTLANALLGRTVSITSDQAGTTRDWVDAQALFISASPDGVMHTDLAVTLIDTAGLRQTEDVLERESMVRSHQQAAKADAIILLVDGTQPLDKETIALLNRYREQPLVVAINKIDVAQALPDRTFIAAPVIEISAKKQTGLGQLMNAILQQLDLLEIGGRENDVEPFAFSERQRAILRQLIVAEEGEGVAECMAGLQLLINGGAGEAAIEAG